MNNVCPIPTPPVTTSAPVVLDVDATDANTEVILFVVSTLNIDVPPAFLTAKAAVSDNCIDTLPVDEICPEFVIAPLFRITPEIDEENDGEDQIEAPNPALPLTLNLNAGFVSPIPTFPVNSAIPTVPSAFILKDGIPDISLIPKIYPVDRTLFTEKSCPALPSNDRVLSSKTYRVIGELFCPVNTILGKDVVSLLVVIRIFLSEFAMLKR